MVFAIIADWDAQFRVSRYNLVDTEPEAIAIVDKLRGVGPDALPLAKQAPNAYYVLMPTPLAGTALFQHRARFWTAIPGSSSMSFNTTLCHAWQSRVTKSTIDGEADRRIDLATSPDNPSRASRVREELPEGPTKIALITRVNALRAAAQALKDSLVAKTPEEVLAVDTSDNIHWPE